MLANKNFTASHAQLLVKEPKAHRQKSGSLHIKRPQAKITD